MQKIIQEHVSAIETAYLNAEAAAAALPDGDVKTAALAALEASHGAAYESFQNFLTSVPSEAVQGVALRSGGTDKDSVAPADGGKAIDGSETSEA